MRKPSPAMIVAVAALFVALGGVGVAATGGNFILGQSNTADRTTLLAGSVASGPQLQVANSDVGAAVRADSAQGRGVVAQHTGTSGAAPGIDASTASADPTAVAVSASNNGGGSALDLNVKGNAPPLTVGSTGKVANLNADLLDGLDSSSFVQGAGQHIYSAHFDAVKQGAPEITLLTIPGAGKLVAYCGGQSFYIGFNGDAIYNIVYEENSQLNGQETLLTNGGRSSSIYFTTSGFKPETFGNALMARAFISTSSRLVALPDGMLDLRVGGWYNVNAGSCVFEAMAQGGIRPGISFAHATGARR